ncbi:Zinc finger DNA binding protein [Operophtera brumata]|uniref:Zinc finger DNA binding protein n=1 Tax=Operophtera brumata TaxID=104452 RepID=A0A0L7KQY0_OPEBR|nr:Zinc finger DNA binding protein [Operophtera brumata]
MLTSNAEIKKSMTSIIKEQNELKARVGDLEKRDKNSEAYVCALEQQVENVERKLRETSIEINNLPTDNNGQMMTLIEQIHKTLQVQFDLGDTRSAYRLPAKPDQPRPIIIEYTTLQKKIELLQAYRKYNMNNKGERLNTSSTGINGITKIIYIKEVLTKKGKHLHYLARDLIKNANWKFCWTVGGKVFIRKEEGQPAVEVKSDDQIASLYKEKPIED